MLQKPYASAAGVLPLSPAHTHFLAPVVRSMQTGPSSVTHRTTLLSSGNAGGW